MARFHDLIEAQMDGATVRWAYLAFFDFKTTPKRVWTGLGPLVAGDGYAYEGLGQLGRLSSIGAGPGGAVDEINLELFGSEAILADVQGDSDQSAGRAVQIMRQFFDVRQFNEAGAWVDWAVIDEPVTVFVGVMGAMTLKRDAETFVIAVPAQSRLKNRARPPNQFFTDRDVKARSPDDNLCLRVAQYSEGSVRWPIF